MGAITGLPTTYTTSFAENTISPFESNAEAVNCSANGYVLRVNASRGSTTTSTAYFDSDTGTDGNQAYTLGTNENITISFTMLNGYYSYTLNTKFAVVNSDGDELLSFTYGANPCKFTDVSIGGSTVADFEEFTGISYNTSKKHNANGVNDGTYPFSSTAGDNPEITIVITGKKFVSVTFNQSSKSISNKTFSKTLSDVTMDLASLQISNTLQDRSGVSGGRASCFKNITISSETVSKEMADYTIVYKDKGGSTIKTSRVVSGYYEDDDVVVLDSDKEPFYNNDGSMKYVYDSDDSEGKKVASDGSTVVTVTFNSYEKRSYSVKAVDGESQDLKTNIKSGYIYTDNTTASFYLPDCVLVDGTLYFRTAEDSYKTQSVTSNNQVFSYEYATRTVDNVVFFVEGENISGASSAAASGNQKLASEGYMGRGSNLKVTTLPAGAYTVYVHYINTNASAQSLLVKAGTADVINATDVTVRPTKDGSVTLSESTDITLTAGGSSTSGVDYIYIVQTGEVVTLNASGYATYSTDKDVTVSGAKAYTADLDFANSTITCAEIDGKVPAGAGVLLFGEAGANVTLTYTTGATALSSNDLKGTTKADGTLAEKGSNDYYALSGDTFMPFDGAAFVHHKAYFEVEGGVVQARSMRIVFGGVTGINEAKAEAAAEKDGKFVINGQLVIKKNGKMFNANGAQMK